MSGRLPIVGIGASAGGVEALRAFFSAMPPDNGLAFVVVMHLDPTHQSMLADIIGSRTTMPVKPIQDGDSVEAEHVYVLPPGEVVTIEDGRLRLRKRAADRHQGPIDLFFTSLAEDQGEDAIGIVLSGGGSDGTLGVVAIKEQGGLTMAQGHNGSEPRFRDMPGSATATGLVDLVVPVELMPERLVSYVRSAEEIERTRISAATNTIYGLLRSRLGHDFSQYKEKTFGRRVQRRMQVLSLTNIDDYVERLKKDQDEVTLLFRDLLIGVTNFFRDSASFEALEEFVIPKLFEASRPDGEIRVWVPGCSTGEELYSIAILLREHMDKLKREPIVRLFATDIDERALTIARFGQYASSAMKEVSPERLRKYFHAEEGSYRVKKELRDLCIFAPHNVIRDPPFSRLDLISCRNVLIYLKAELQARLFPIFHYGLRPDGYLFLGLSEGLARHGDLFASVDKQNRIFQRRDLLAPLTNPILPPATAAKRFLTPARSQLDNRAPKSDLLRTATAAVTERYAPAHVVVNEAGEVLHYSVRTGKYLEAAVGTPSRDLFSMARRGLRPELRAALRQAVETRRRVLIDQVLVDTDDGNTQLIALNVEPITDGGEAVYLIVFTDVGPVRPRSERTSEASSTSDNDTTTLELDRELQETKERLQASIEELETSNEELKSSNEELFSVNEELQSSNEELEASTEETQSINEELQTVNAELQRKVLELDQSNSDLRNVFNSTQVGTLFLDHNLIIRSFTPAVTDIYSLVPGDRGRSLADLVSRLDERDVVSDIRDVIEKHTAAEHRVSANKGAAHYLMRIMPYRTRDGRMDGVLVTFANITSIVASEEHLKVLTAELSHRVKNALAVAAALATQTGERAQSVEDFVDTFLGRLRSLARTHELLFETKWADVSLESLITRELAPFAKDNVGRLDLSGPRILLKPRAALTLGIVVHELATNSVKYGALAVPEGRLEVTWKVDGGSEAQQLHFRWLERDGPPVAVPVERGFGTELIEQATRFDFDGEAKLAFEEKGLRCILRVPMGPNFVVPTASKQSAQQ